MSLRLFSRSTGVGLWLALALTLVPFSAMANWGKDGKGACKADVDKFCSQVKPGKGAILACLKDHRSQLQTTCQEKLPIWEKFQAMRETCKADREKFCGQTSREEMHACMKENHDKFSTSCRAAMDELKTWKKSNQPSVPSGNPPSDLPPPKQGSSSSTRL